MTEEELQAEQEEALQMLINSSKASRLSWVFLGTKASRRTFTYST